jgi:hypothetical protein
VLATARQRWRHEEKERVTLRSLFKDIMLRASCSRYGVNFDGKKKSNEEAKERQSIGLTKKRFFVANRSLKSSEAVNHLARLTRGVSLNPSPRPVLS